MKRGFVTFDYGQTLCDIDTDMLAARCRERGAEADGARLEAALDGAWAAYDAGIGRGEGGHPWKTFMRALLTGGAIEGDVASLVDFLWDAQPTRNLWRRPVPGMLELAEELVGAGVGVAIISNSEGHLAELLAEVGLAELFPIALDSGKLGLEKPDPRIFERALAELGARPHEAVHVGDSFAADVRGALGAGLAAVWFRGRAPATTELDPARVRVAHDAASARSALRTLGVPI
ncbi:MAG TPA: HAD family hydrolase [Byssovorax sp.]|jgi:putative hydrolase of the HAD superfamily